MTKQEIKKAIENGESVWAIYCKEIYEIKVRHIQTISDGEIDYFDTSKDLYLRANLLDIYKTKAEAEHYLQHADVTRVEQLPFLTWEEFLKEYSFDFYSENHEWFIMYWNDVDGIVIENIISIDDKKTWDLTEASFYKAYDECVRLFRSEG